jgi:hypothetical protein
VVSRNSAIVLRPSSVVAVTTSVYELEEVRPVTVASCCVEVAVGAVQITGASRPYAIRELAGSLVCQERVAENGSSEVVCTFWISGGGPLGTAGAGAVVVVVVVSVGEVVVCGSDAAGSARKVSARPYGALKAIASESAAGLPFRAIDSASTPERGRRPGVEAIPVFSSAGTTRRPPGGANVSADPD